MDKSEYKCTRCGFCTTYKCSLKKHLENKKPCDTTYSDTSREELLQKLVFKDYNEVTYDCSFCATKFNFNHNRLRHERTCKSKPANTQNALIEQLANEVALLKAQIKPSIDALQQRIKDLEIQNAILKNKKNEYYYQCILEKLYNCSHVRYDCCETDLTNDLFHGEIKHWPSWKEGLGQLMTANSIDPKPELRAFMFGKYSEKAKTKATRVMKALGIRVYQFDDDDNLVLL